ncbi:MAG: TrkA family potassium uptake protein [Ruminococcaceae bacterium]|nr:TrkA family potassium uptake protein [Oscillospiraceae bacterium]
MKQFLIVGLGTVGQHLCMEFSKLKCETLVLDRSAEAVEENLKYATSAKVADCTVGGVLESLNVSDFDATFVCVGGDLRASLEITSRLKELGARRIFASATDDIQDKFLRKVGADFIIYPERDVTRRLAVSESSDRIFDYIKLTDEYAIYEITPEKSWIGKSIKSINFRVKYNLNVLGYKKSDGIFRATVSPDYIIKEDEHLMVMGKDEDVKKLASK